MYKRTVQNWTKHLDFILLDLVSLQLAFIFASLIRHHELPYFRQIYRQLGLSLVMIDIIVTMLLNTMHDVLKRGYYKELSQTFKHCLAVFALTTAYMFLLQTGSDYSRIVLFITFLLHILIGYCMRILWKRHLKSRGVLSGKTESMLAVLNVETAEKMLARLRQVEYDPHEIIGIVLNAEDERKEIAGVPVVCSLADAADYISREWVDAVYIDCPAYDPAIKSLMDDCYTMAVPVHYHIQAVSRKGSKQFAEKVASTTVLTTSINYATPLQVFVKRIFDILGGLIGSVFALIVMAVFGPVIKKKSPGPVLFRQERIGLNGKRFEIYKLRTMYMDAEERKKELWKQSRGDMFKLDFDPRIIGNEILPDGTKKTGIGDFLRRHSLDEFPQFFNVLLGQMSMVGTRPPTVDEWERYEYHHRARLACKPGITGMWQVSGRSEITDFEEVVKLDTQYITNWSMGLDLKILFKTVWIVFTGRGAL